MTATGYVPSLKINYGYTGYSGFNKQKTLFTRISMMLMIFRIKAIRQQGFQEYAFAYIRFFAYRNLLTNLHQFEAGS